MLKIENTEVMGWEHAIRGMRNPKNSWEKSDSHWDYGKQRVECITVSHFDDAESNIYKSRRHHKLDEWHTLCDRIESLPYSALITGTAV